MSSPSKQQASEFLRTVNPEQGFLFYNDIDEYTGTSARSLDEFLDRLRTIGARSLQFHAGRGDFENWIHMMGDDQLARQLKEARNGPGGEALRERLVLVVQARRDLLKKQASSIP